MINDIYEFLEAQDDIHVKICENNTWLNYKPIYSSIYHRINLRDYMKDYNGGDYRFIYNLILSIYESIYLTQYINHLETKKYIDEVSFNLNKLKL